MKQPHPRLPQRPRKSPSHRRPQIGLQHHRIPHHSNRHRSRHCNRLFHQTLFHPNPHIPTHQLQQILSLQRRSPPQQPLHQPRPHRRSPSHRHLRKRFRHFLQRQPRSSIRLFRPSQRTGFQRTGCPIHGSFTAMCGFRPSPSLSSRQQIKPSRTQIPMPFISRRKLPTRSPTHRQQSLTQQSPTCIQLPRIRLSKRSPRQIHRKQPSILPCRIPRMHPDNRLRNRRPLLQSTRLTRQPLRQLRHIPK